MGMLSNGILPKRVIGIQNCYSFGSSHFTQESDNLEGWNGVEVGGRFRREGIFTQKQKRKEGKLTKNSTELYEAELLFMWKFLV